MTTLDTGSKAKDQMYGTLNSTIWTTIESNTAIICACLPMLKSPLATLFPRLFPRGSADEYPNNSNGARRRGASTYTPGRSFLNQHHILYYTGSKTLFFTLLKSCKRTVLAIFRAGADFKHLHRSRFPRPKLASCCLRCLGSARKQETIAENEDLDNSEQSSCAQRVKPGLQQRGYLRQSRCSYGQYQQDDSC